MHLIEAAKHTSSPTIDVETWLQSVGLLLRQCPWEAAAKAEGSAAQQSLLQPLLALLGQLVAAASENVHVEAIVSIVVQVINIGPAPWPWCTRTLQLAGCLLFWEMD